MWVGNAVRNRETAGSVLIIMRYLVKFIDIGRNKRSWEKECEVLDEVALTREVLRSKALMSKAVDVFLLPGHKTGEVIAGGFRTVGRLEVIDRQEQSVSA